MGFRGVKREEVADWRLDSGVAPSVPVAPNNYATQVIAFLGRDGYPDVSNGPGALDLGQSSFLTRLDVEQKVAVATSAVIARYAQPLNAFAKVGEVSQRTNA